jgi:hypothetical protein
MYRIQETRDDGRNASRFSAGFTGCCGFGFGFGFG